MKIVLTSVFVDDQDTALRFYTDVLGFVMKSGPRTVQGEASRRLPLRHN